MKKLLYVTAYNQNDQLVHIDNASKEEQYHCLECGVEMILRKSELGLRRTNFAHKTLAANCTPESVLHRSFKEFLFQRINNHLATDTPLSFSWKCDYCKEQHKGNLIKKCNNVKMEFAMEQARPDIALLDSQGNVIAVIEIVVTHRPEEKVLAFYRENNIIVITIELTKEDDLNRVFDEVLSLS
ncbi:hypothetical protein P4V43_19435 [Brevibacillus fortis]|uniref:hypothetical protein n=1 Tax=Brevibacillus fortis TaxID=2126352 RepID=UPI002E1D5624|nr:hypothetical protein [Brevibacillus fortis]